MESFEIFWVIFLFVECPPNFRTVSGSAFVFTRGNALLECPRKEVATKLTLINIGEQCVKRLEYIIL